MSNPKNSKGTAKL